MDENFLLQSETAQKLYHSYAADAPILDYHCHINPQEIYEDRQFENITQVWLGGDHYKWRLCVPVVSMKNTSPAMLPTKKNS